MGSKFYAVRKGRSVGIYNNWDDCKSQVHGYPGCQYKSFSSLKEAEDYLAQNVPSPHPACKEQKVDGSIASDYKSLSSLKRVEICPTQDVKAPETSSKKLKVDGSIASDYKSFSSLKSVEVCPTQDVKAPETSSKKLGLYHLEFDGASKGNPGKAGAGAVLRYPDGSVAYTLKEGVGVATNNVAEYRALIRGLKFCLDKGIDRIHVRGDSNLVCMQEFNSEADALANAAIYLSDGEWTSS